MDSSQEHNFFFLFIFCTTSYIFLQQKQLEALKIGSNHRHYGPPTNVTKTLYFPNFSPTSIFTPTHQLKLLANARVSQDNGVIQIPDASQAVDHTYQVGRAIYSSPIRLFDPLTHTPASFQTTFSFQTTGSDPQDSATATTTTTSSAASGGGGMAFVIVPDEFSVGRAGPWLGIVNDACIHYKAFAVEFDTSHDPEVGDPDDNHVGINAGAAVSFKTASLSSEAGVSLHDNSVVHRAWITYDGKARWINVYLGLDGDPFPEKPILSSPLNLYPLLQEYMFVGFSASTGNSSQFHNIFSWNFTSVSPAFIQSRSNKICHRNLARQVSKYSTADDIKRYNPPSSFLIFVAVVGLFTAALLSFYFNSKQEKSSSSSASAINNVFLEKKRRPRPPSKPRRFSPLELSRATRRFSQVEVLASDYKGVLYRGTLRNGSRLAVKRFPTRFAAPSSSRLDGSRVLKRIGELNQVSHPSLAPIRGWCCDTETVVVYDYYPNGSVERWLFGGLGTILWTRRVRLIKDVAEALSYMHSKGLVHGNVSTSSVFLDNKYDAALGDYGVVLSRSSSTAVMGMKNDVFEFGMVVLEIVAGKKATELIMDHDEHDHRMGLLEFALRMQETGEMVNVVDQRLMAINCVDSEEALRFLKIGLSCCTSEINGRPSMEEVVNFLNEIQPIPNLPTS